jgi:hypothetical protein
VKKNWYILIVGLLLLLPFTGNKAIKAVHQYILTSENTAFEQSDNIPVHQLGENSQISVLVFSHVPRLNNDFCLGTGVCIKRMQIALISSLVTLPVLENLMQQKTLRSTCLLI